MFTEVNLLGISCLQDCLRFLQTPESEFIKTINRKEEEIERNEMGFTYYSVESLKMSYWRRKDSKYRHNWP